MTGSADSSPPAASGASVEQLRYAELTAALRLIANTDLSAFSDATHLRSMLADIAPGLPASIIAGCVEATRFRLPELLRANPHEPVEHIATLLAARTGSLDAQPYVPFVRAFATALGHAPSPTQPSATPLGDDPPPPRPQIEQPSPSSSPPPHLRYMATMTAAAAPLTPDAPAGSDDDEFDDDEFDPLDVLLSAIQFADEISDGRTGSLDQWAELVYRELRPCLRPYDWVDLFVPTVFALDSSHPTTLPRRVVRSLRVPHWGATVALVDRVICAWMESTPSARHMSVSINYIDIRRVEYVEYEIWDGVVDGFELQCGELAWPILLRDEPRIARLRELLHGRLLGTTTPVWKGNIVAAWETEQDDGTFTSEPGWAATE